MQIFQSTICGILLGVHNRYHSQSLMGYFKLPVTPFVTPIKEIFIVLLKYVRSALIISTLWHRVLTRDVVNFLIVCLRRIKHVGPSFA